MSPNMAAILVTLYHLDRSLERLEPGPGAAFDTRASYLLDRVTRAFEGDLEDLARERPEAKA